MQQMATVTWYCEGCDTLKHTPTKESYPLKCSHILCKSCMMLCNVNNRCMQCPACQKLTLPPPTRTSREYIIRETEISQPLRSLRHSSSSSSNRESVKPPVPPRPEPSSVLSNEVFVKKVDNFIQKTNVSCKEDLDRCKMVNDSILSERESSDGLRKNVAKLRKTIKEMEEKIKKYQTQLDMVYKWLENHDSTLEEEHRHVEEKSKKLRAFQYKAELAQNYEEISLLIDQDPHVETHSRLQDIENMLQKRRSKRECLQELIQERTSNVNLIQEFMTGTPENADVEGILEHPVEDHYITPISTMGNITVQDPQETSQITVDDLQKMSPEVRYQVSKGKVLVAQNYKGRQRYAKVFFSDDGDELLLGHLCEAHVHPEHHILQYSDVMGQRKPSTQQVFLALSTKRSSLGKLYIRLLSDSPRCRQFHLLCTGEMGPSYANSRILEVVQKGHIKLEYIRCGDYELNDGTGGSSLGPLLLDEEDVEGFSPSLAGTVSAVSRDNYIGAQFIIHTRHNPKRKNSVSFGKVEKGLRVLNRVICQYQNISEIFVKECGIVLWKFGSDY